MKKIIIVVSLCLAAVLIGIGVYIKDEVGYVLDTETDMQEAVAEIKHMEPSYLQINKYVDYISCETDSKFKMIWAESNDAYFIHIFRQQENGKYEFYYNYEMTGKNTAGFLEDPNEKFVLCWYYNEFHFVKEYEMTWEGNPGMTHDVFIGNDTFSFEVFDTSQAVLLDIVFIDDNGQRLDIPYIIQTIR